MIAVPAPAATASSKPIIGKLAFAALVIAYFVFFNWSSLNVHFALDDLGNIDHYWGYSTARLLLCQITPWSGDYRPMGGIFYLSVYNFAGLDPVPYQAVLLVILLAAVFLTHRFALQLGASELAAGMVAIVMCYHAGIANLYYNAAFVYDAMCWLFYIAAFVYYLRFRCRGRLLGPWATAVFLVLFLCALNSKEMAVTIPITLLAYELLYHPPKWNRPALVGWLRGPARMVLITGVLNAADVYGKVTGPDALSKQGGYQPLLSLARVLDFHRLLFGDLFENRERQVGWGFILGVYAFLAAMAWLRRRERPLLRFLLLYIVAVPLPIEFLVGKSQACFVLIVVGWVTFAAVLVADLIPVLTHWMTMRPHWTPRGRQAVQWSLLAVLLGVWAIQQADWQRRDIFFAMGRTGEETWDVIVQFPKFQRPEPGSRVAWLADPLPGFDMWHLGRLWIHDRSVDVHVRGMGPKLSPAEIDALNHVYTFDNRTMRQLR